MELSPYIIKRLSPTSVLIQTGILGEIDTDYYINGTRIYIVSVMANTQGDVVEYTV